MGRHHKKHLPKNPAETKVRFRHQGWIILLTACLVIALIAINVHPFGSPDTSSSSREPTPSVPAVPSESLALGGTPPSLSPAATTAPITATTTSAAGKTTSIPPAVREKLTGRWQRPDGGYVMTILRVAEDGTIQATYHNPNPIHVARALSKMNDGQALLYVELRDQGYPGNYYELAFDPAKDEFIGVYHHLGVHQDFEVNFVRLK